LIRTKLLGLAAAVAALAVSPAMASANLTGAGSTLWPR
jgi:hypothetical protein